VSGDCSYAQYQGNQGYGCDQPASIDFHRFQVEHCFTPFSLFLEAAVSAASLAYAENRAISGHPKLYYFRVVS
jgi:hypothetical protein